MLNKKLISLNGLKLHRSFTDGLNKRRDLMFLLVAVALSLYLLALANPFTMPTVDDSAIVMRYLKNFQTGHFFAYNVEDGPVFGLSGFIFGLSTGTLSWLGLSPQASLMVVCLLGSVGFFYNIQRILFNSCGIAIVSSFSMIILYFSSYYIPLTFYMGLEVSINLFIISSCFLFFLEKSDVKFYICCGLALISKLDSISIVVGLLFLQGLRSKFEGNFNTEIRKFFILFVVPVIVWIIIATAIFGSPIPQSFLSKFLFRQKAEATSWFPFIEPMINTRESMISVGLIMTSIGISAIVAFIRQRLFLPSLVFSGAALGTLLLYYVYNPGEKMPWYYPLPEWLMLSVVILVIFDGFRIPNRIVSIPVTLAGVVLASAVFHFREPMNKAAPSQDAYWQTIYEGERLASGVLANAVAPKVSPVLWTGHGYPAYLFDGYVADYSGLNTRAIWKSLKAVQSNDPEAVAFLKELGIEGEPLQYKTEMYLIKMYNANVFMLHGLFPEQVQKALGLRLAGSFYTIDLVKAPAFRVFFKDAEHPTIVRKVLQASIDATGGDVKKEDLYTQGQAIKIPYDAGSASLLFGAKAKDADQEIVLSDSNGKDVGVCLVAKIEDPRFGDKVRPCEIEIPPGMAPGQLSLRAENKGVISVFEPAFRIGN